MEISCSRSIRLKRKYFSVSGMMEALPLDFKFIYGADRNKAQLLKVRANG